MRLSWTPQRLDPEDPAHQHAYKLMAGLHKQLVVAGYDGVDLEQLLVRMLFCLFAEDTGIFEPLAFRLYLEGRSREDGSDLGASLSSLFQVLDTPPHKRSKHLGVELAAFPYVDGGLFSARLRIADFSVEMRAALLDASRLLWAKISPAAFGSLFQGISTASERRAQGAHYTSERDILKICRGLFLEDLEAALADALADRSTRRSARLAELHRRMESIRLFDPACGCGIFLVIAYRELRRLELKLLRATVRGQQDFEVGALLRVNVSQAYGIEAQEWPARIAAVALWLVDHQMNQEASEAFGQYFIRLPLTHTPHIRHDNALRVDWSGLLPPGPNVFVLGNPPFIGHQYRSAEQQDDMLLAWGSGGRFGRLDYVTAWYARAAKYIEDTTARVAFVSTNSICQGEQVDTLWSALFALGVQIDFAHRTFPWHSDSPGGAHVHVVIIGFSMTGRPRPTLYDYEGTKDKSEPLKIQCTNISPYLVEGPRMTIPSRAPPRQGHPRLLQGSKPVDGGNLIFTDEQRKVFVSAEPAAEPLFRPYVGGDELINGNWRWCLWLKDTPAAALRKLPLVRERLAAVRRKRAESPTPNFRRMADSPTLFAEDRQPDRPYLAIPEVSSESRRYLPVGFLPANVIASNKLQVIADGDIFYFGILVSAIHMAWVRVVSGRLKSDISYAPSVLHNFPLPSQIAESAREKVEAAAQAVLDVRARYLPPHGDQTLGDLYDPYHPPKDLVAAHTKLDKTVDRLYRKELFHSDRERVEHLFTLFAAQRAATERDKPDN